MTPAIETRGLTKRFGEVTALDGVDLLVEPGTVFGFLGPNGAGKTTTLRILLGMARASAGSVSVLGHDVTADPVAVRQRLGFLPDVPGYYPWMRAEEFLRFAGSLFAIPAATLEPRVQVLLEMAGLAGVRQRVGGYSRGMRQRLGVAQALINAPDVLFLDEPTSALDPLGRKDVLDMIAGLRGRTTVFFSTHILGDVERVCDRVAILAAGRVVAEGSVDELKQRYGGASRYEIVVESGSEALVRALSGEAWAERAELADGVVTVVVTDAAQARVRVPAIVAGLGLGLVRFEPREASLEDVFVRLVDPAASTREGDAS